jgi:hypothetical protein
LNQLRISIVNRVPGTLLLSGITGSHLTSHSDTTKIMSTDKGQHKPIIQSANANIQPLSGMQPATGGVLSKQEERALLSALRRGAFEKGGTVVTPSYAQAAIDWASVTRTKGLMLDMALDGDLNVAGIAEDGEVIFSRNRAKEKKAAAATDRS